MAYTQYVMTAGAARAEGIEPMSDQVADDWVAIVCKNNKTGDVVWASYDRADVDPTSRLNPSVPAKDVR